MSPYVSQNSDTHNYQNNEMASLLVIENDGIHNMFFPLRIETTNLFLLSGRYKKSSMAHYKF